jgi:uncharacterized small protein (DUF1192 family)
MTFIDDDKPKRPASHDVGSDLSALSIEELEQRITLLQDEIARLETEKRKKAADRLAADSLFRL